jgi:hypothetical protein
MCTLFGLDDLPLLQLSEILYIFMITSQKCILYMHTALVFSTDFLDYFLLVSFSSYFISCSAFVWFPLSLSLSLCVKYSFKASCSCFSNDQVLFLPVFERNIS